MGWDLSVCGSGLTVCTAQTFFGCTRARLSTRHADPTDRTIHSTPATTTRHQNHTPVATVQPYSLPAQYSLVRLPAAMGIARAHSWTSPGNRTTALRSLNETRLYGGQPGNRTSEFNGHSLLQRERGREALSSTTKSPNHKIIRGEKYSPP